MTALRPKRSLIRGLAAKFGLTREEEPERRIFICGGPNCCTREEGIAAWDRLKRRLKSKGLSRGNPTVTATKCDCFGVCGGGPVAFVYPERIWYSEMSGKRLDRVIREHLIAGGPVKDYSFEPPPGTREPLAAPSKAAH